MHAEGSGVSKDCAEAVRWYGEAAEQGHARAQFNLGLMNALGRGVPQDYVRAYMWLNLASSRAVADDHAPFADIRDAVASLMTPQQIAEAQALARNWQPKLKR